MPKPTATPSFPENAEPKRRDIIAAQKIIADISSGVYRSPAAAIKELIANAYDADATRITISTDPPHLRTFTITDDGSGMTISDFLDVMAHIGGSRKRKEGDLSPIFKRKLIGRIGIGLLSVAQLGTRFYLSSKKRGENTRFLAEVNLEPFHKDETALLSMVAKEGADDGQVMIGAIQYVDNIPDDPENHFTVITVPDAKKGLQSEITGLVRRSVGATELLNLKRDGVVSFEQIAEITSAAKRADLVLDNYYFMLWELGLLCPVDYLPGGPFRPDVRAIENLDMLALPKPTAFNIYVNGSPLYRPQLFPGPTSVGYSSPDPKIYPLKYTALIANRQLRLSGYVYCQQPNITPEEVKGVHIRIRDVGIGMYDRTWLGYPFDEGLKFGQISGEIFVEEGLESALNIDRDSFRETDVHYQALKAYVWTVLRKTVFPDFKTRQRDFRKAKQRVVTAEEDQAFEDAILELPAPAGSASANRPSGESLLHLIRSGEDTVSAPVSPDSSIPDWKAIVASLNLSSEAEIRFERVLRVLVSSELFVGIVKDDLESVLLALAIAVR
ncbi:ATP-binding protein [Granulicella aggregans]|uniref:ATP-binding protein n=1 Tax=Granulicella aggregans TaxID=474949 RepID=UPI0021DF65EE|nr:ATP-binding protein [Granulicella aggregans]